ncbi:lysozyme [Rickettsiales bacterium LUAb2]
MQITKKGIDFIKNFEALRQYLYQDDAGNWTVGWGHLVPDNQLELFKANIKASGGVFSLFQCETLFNNDLKPFEDYLNNVCKQYNVNLNQNQYDALCSFCFNNGHFKPAMLVRFQNNDLNAIGLHLLEYIHDNKGNVEQGLITRRQAEHDLFFSNK